MKIFRIVEIALFLAAIAFSLTFYLRLDDTKPTKEDVAAVRLRLAELNRLANAKFSSETSPRHPSSNKTSDEMTADETQPSHLAKQFEVGASPSTDSGREGHIALMEGTLRRAIILSPWWAERPRTWKLPIPILTTARQSLPEDFADLNEIILLAFPKFPGANLDETLALLKSGGFEPVGKSEKFGAILLVRLKNSRPRQATFKATDDLMTGEFFAGEAPCQKLKDRHICTATIGGKKRRSIHVLPTYRELNSRPFRCVDFMPLGQTPMTAHFKDVNLGSGFTVVAGTVGTSNARKKPRRQPINFNVLVDSVPLVQWTFFPEDLAERRLTLTGRELESAIATEGNASKGSQRTDDQRDGHHVTIQVTGDTLHPTGFCFEAEAWK